MRNRYPRPDDNHHIPRDYLRDRCGGFTRLEEKSTLAYTANFRGNTFIIYDTSKIGGIFPDWIIEHDGRMAWLEVKTEEAYKAKDHSLKDGEKLLQNNTSLPYFIICNDKMFEEVLEALL